MSSILRALRTLPIYVVTGKTRYNEFHPDAAVPTQDTGTLNDSTNAGGALGVTQLDDVTGLVAWKDYIPVQEEAARTVPYSYDANGYFPIQKIGGGAIFEPPLVSYSNDFSGLSLADFTAVGSVGGTASAADGYMSLTTTGGTGSDVKLRLDAVADLTNFDLSVSVYSAGNTYGAIHFCTTHWGTDSENREASGYFVFFNPGVDISLYKGSNSASPGSPTQIALASSQPTDVGSFFTIRVVKDGSLITVYKNAVQAMQVTDATYSSGQFAFGAHQFNGNMRFDTITIDELA